MQAMQARRWARRDWAQVSRGQRARRRGSNGGARTTVAPFVGQLYSASGGSDARRLLAAGCWLRGHLPAWRARAMRERCGLARERICGGERGERGRGEGRNSQTRPPRLRARAVERVIDGAGARRRAPGRSRPAYAPCVRSRNCRIPRSLDRAAGPRVSSEKTVHEVRSREPRRSELARPPAAPASSGLLARGRAARAHLLWPPYRHVS